MEVTVWRRQANRRPNEAVYFQTAEMSGAVKRVWNGGLFLPDWNTGAEQRERPEGDRLNST